LHNVENLLLGLGLEVDSGLYKLLLFLWSGLEFGYALELLGWELALELLLGLNRELLEVHVSILQ